MVVVCSRECLQYRVRRTLRLGVLLTALHLCHPLTVLGPPPPPVCQLLSPPTTFSVYSAALTNRPVLLVLHVPTPFCGVCVI